MQEGDWAETLVSATETGAAGGYSGPAAVGDAADDLRGRRDRNTQRLVWRDAAVSRDYTHGYC